MAVLRESFRKLAAALAQTVGFQAVWCNPISAFLTGREKCRLESGQNDLANRASALDQRMGTLHVSRRDLSQVGLQSGSDTALVHQLADLGQQSTLLAHVR